MPLVQAHNVPGLSADWSQGLKTYHDTKTALDQKELQKKQLGLQEQAQQHQQEYQTGQLGLAQKKFESEEQQRQQGLQQQAQIGEWAKIASDPNAPAQARQEAQRNLMVTKPEIAKQINDQLGIDTKEKADAAYKFAANLQNVPAEQREPLIRARIDEIRARGGDPKDTEKLLSMPPDQQNAALGWIQAANTPAEDLRKQNAPSDIAKKAVEAGYKPGTPEYQKFISDAVNKPQVSITNQGETAEKTESGKLDAQAHAKDRELADNANTTLNTVQAARAALANTDTGSLTEMKTKMGALAESLGFPDLAKSIGKVSTNQALQSQLNRLVLQEMAKQKGPQTDADRKFIAEEAGQLGDTKEALEFKLAALESMALQSKEKFEFVEDLRLKGISLGEANKAWRDSRKDLPMVSKTVRTENGLPVFYSQFKDRVRSNDPEATDDDIKQAWLEANGKAKPKEEANG